MRALSRLSARDAFILIQVFRLRLKLKVVLLQQISTETPRSLVGVLMYIRPKGFYLPVQIILNLSTAY